MAKIVDARGRACPQPVILTRNALQAGEPVTTIVDSETAVHNVTRMAERAGYQVEGERRADGIYLHIRPAERAGEQAAAAPAADRAAPSAGPLVVLVAGDTLGRGESELGGILMRSLFHTLGEVSPLPDTVILINSGVKLAVPGSPVLEDLRALVQVDLPALEALAAWRFSRAGPAWATIS